MAEHNLSWCTTCGTIIVFIPLCSEEVLQLISVFADQLLFLDLKWFNDVSDPFVFVSTIGIARWVKEMYEIKAGYYAAALCMWILCCWLMTLFQQATLLCLTGCHTSSWVSLVLQIAADHCFLPARLLVCCHAIHSDQHLRYCSFPMVFPKGVRL